MSAPRSRPSAAARAATFLHTDVQQDRCTRNGFARDAGEFVRVASLQDRELPQRRPVVLHPMQRTAAGDFFTSSSRCHHVNIMLRRTAATLLFHASDHGVRMSRPPR